MSSIVDSSGSWDDLTTTSVDSVGVKGNVHNVESDTSHVFFSHDGFFGGPLEGSFARVLDFVKILDGLGLIDKEIWTSGLWAEAPDLLCVIDIPFVVVSKTSVSFLLILFAGDFISFDGIGKLITEWFGNDVDSVVLVW